MRTELNENEKAAINGACKAYVAAANTPRSFLKGIAKVAGSISRVTTQVVNAPRLLDKEGLILTAIAEGRDSVLSTYASNEEKLRALYLSCEAGTLVEDHGIVNATGLTEVLTRLGLSEKAAAAKAVEMFSYTVVPVQETGSIPSQVTVTTEEPQTVTVGA